MSKLQRQSNYVERSRFRHMHMVFLRHCSKQVLRIELSTRTSRIGTRTFTLDQLDPLMNLTAGKVKKFT